MSNSKRKWWLAIVVVCCLSSATFADQDRGGDRGRDPDRGKCDPRYQNCQHQQQVPEGGSPAIYLLGAGLTCFGAMLLRSRQAKPAQS
jgi:hypothetical protein